MVKKVTAIEIINATTEMEMLKDEILAQVCGLDGNDASTFATVCLRTKRTKK